MSALFASPVFSQGQGDDHKNGGKSDDHRHDDDARGDHGDGHHGDDDDRDHAEKRRNAENEIRALAHEFDQKATEIARWTEERLAHILADRKEKNRDDEVRKTVEQTERRLSDLSRLVDKRIEQIARQSGKTASDVEAALRLELARNHAHLAATLTQLQATLQNLLDNAAALGLSARTIAVIREALTALGVVQQFVDRTPPTITFTAPPTPWVRTATPTISATFADDVTGVNAASARVTLDGVDVTAAATITAPATATLVQATGDVFLSATVSDPSPGSGVNLASITVLVDGVDRTAEFAVTGTNPASANISATLALSAGSHTFSVSARDLAGNLGASSFTFTLSIPTAAGVVAEPPGGFSTIAASGQAVRIDLSVKDTLNNPLAGIRVGVRIIEGKGRLTNLAGTEEVVAQSVSPILEIVTDAGGVASTLFYASGESGAVVIEATLLDFSTTAPTLITVTVHPGAPASLRLTAPGTLTAGEAGDLVIEVLDAQGNVVNGGPNVLTGDVRVALTGTAAPNGSAAFPETFIVTFPDTDSTPGTKTLPGALTFAAAGEQTISAEVVATPTVTGAVTVDVTPAALARLSTVSGDAQSGTVATSLMAPFVVRATDAFGNGRRAESITFEAERGAFSAVPNPLSVFAGGGPVGTPALSFPVFDTGGMAVTAGGDLLFTNTTLERLFRLGAGGVDGVTAPKPFPTPLNLDAGFRGVGGLARRMFARTPQGVAVDPAGNVYLVAFPQSRVIKIAPSGLTSDVAGSRTATTLGDGGPATADRPNRRSSTCRKASPARPTAHGSCRTRTTRFAESMPAEPPPRCWEPARRGSRPTAQ